MKDIPELNKSTEVSNVTFRPKIWDCSPPNIDPIMFPITIMLAVSIKNKID